MEQLIVTAAAIRQQQQNKALIAEYRALALAQGKVWSELTELEITKMIVDHETAKSAAAFEKSWAKPGAKSDAQECSVTLPATVATAAEPPKWFDLSYGESKPILDHICHLTQRFTVLDPEFTYWLIDRIGRRQFTTFGYMPAPPSVDVTKQVIGTDGYFFKLTTSNTGVDFIWHDRAKNNFLFWGEKQSVIQAMKIIRSRIVSKSRF
jgi:hypothetical protein